MTMNFRRVEHFAFAHHHIKLIFFVCFSFFVLNNSCPSRMVVQTYNPSAVEAEAGRLSWGKPGLGSDCVSKNKQENKIFNTYFD